MRKRIEKISNERQWKRRRKKVKKKKKIKEASSPTSRGAAEQILNFKLIVGVAKNSRDACCIPSF